MNSERRALAEIAQLVNKYKVEDSKRGVLCREMQAIFYKYNLPNCVRESNDWLVQKEW